MIARYRRSLRSEFRKLTATRAWWLLSIVLFIYVALVAVMFAFMFGTIGDLMGEQAGLALDPLASAKLVYSATTSMGYAIPLILGGLAVTAEVRHRTLVHTFAAEPHRGVVLMSKLTVLFLAGAVLGVVGLLASAGVGGAVIALTGGDPVLGDPEIWAQFGRTLLTMGLWGAIGVGLGALVRSQAAVIIIALAFTQFLEPILRMVAGLWDWTAGIGRFLPGAAGDALTGTGLLSDMGSLDPTLDMATTAPLAPWAGGLVMLGYVVVLAGIAWLTRWRADES